MAIPNYDSLSVALSKDIGDAVAAATSNGNRWSSAARDIHLNQAIRRWIMKRILVKDWFALRGYVAEEAQTLGSNIKTLVSWTGDVSYIIEAYDATTNLPIKRLPEELRTWTKTGGNSYLTASTTNLFWVIDGSSLRIYGSAATDSILLTYVKKHTDLAANTGSTDIAIDSPYWPQILDLAVKVAMEEDPTQFNLARAQVKEEQVTREIATG